MLIKDLKFIPHTIDVGSNKHRTYICTFSLSSGSFWLVFGLFWVTLGRSALFWIVLACFESFWIVLACFGSFWVVLADSIV